jgi:hypothetical protein
MPDNTIYVGRPGRWGNPFIVSAEPDRLEHYADFSKNVDLWQGWPCKDRAAAVAAYRKMVAPTLSKEDIRELRGKNLACWCAIGKPCHADVLLEIANKDGE